MPLLHVYDSSDSRIVETAATRGVHDRLGAANGKDLLTGLDGLVAAGSMFDRILFETHGAPGRIYFGSDYLDAYSWGTFLDYNFAALTTRNARVYFNGCNVAEGKEGWAFLDSVVPVLLRPGGGQVFGQTSLGFANFFNGHVIHFWGTTRRVFADATGTITGREE